MEEKWKKKTNKLHQPFAFCKHAVFFSFFNVSYRNSFYWRMFKQTSIFFFSFEVEKVNKNGCSRVLEYIKI